MCPEPAINSRDLAGSNRPAAHLCNSNPCRVAANEPLSLFPRASLGGKSASDNGVDVYDSTFVLSMTLACMAVADHAEVAIHIIKWAPACCGSALGAPMYSIAIPSRCRLIAVRTRAKKTGLSGLSTHPSTSPCGRVGPGVVNASFHAAVLQLCLSILQMMLDASKAQQDDFGESSSELACSRCAVKLACLVQYKALEVCATASISFFVW
ncbi:uncharacterized protein F5Z01DRAFT_160588 [Emericellopsis atlantica]|uniref:Uncharacterized protein n=1 Tax=Emericellopsis atlantica TaxID=2614577 RepID=A0A9P7ZJI0_9HYPO|nr:uncharacterized protein F5Z01DRAFT_160588 [Emericellopsis atlantica]KAG9253264.1 hypothetical protein F5Z01DRAFT_160588 [Emericellopsis atlantica]